MSARFATGAGNSIGNSFLFHLALAACLLASSIICPAGAVVIKGDTESKVQGNNTDSELDASELDSKADNITRVSSSSSNLSQSQKKSEILSLRQNQGKVKKEKTEEDLKKENPSKNRPTVKLPENLIRLPLTRQATNYTCGVSALQSVLAYYGEEYSEMPLSKTLKANTKNGTAYMEIKGFSEKNGFHVDIHKDMALTDLKALIDRKLPVICLLQAWSEVPIDYSTEWNDGHYVVAVGYDEKNIFFMDPSTLGTFAYIPEGEFIERWHDTDGKERLHHFGMVVSRDKVKYQPDVATFME